MKVSVSMEAALDGAGATRQCSGMIRTVVLALALASCAPAVAPSSSSDAPRVAESITYETGPCFGTCPVYSVTVSSDGRGTFTGTRFTSVTGERTFTMSPADYAAFAAVLTKHLPQEGVVAYAPGETNCPNAPTDMPSARLSRTVDGKTGGINFYFGCGRDNPELAEAVRRAPTLLPIAEFIGRR